MNSWLRRARGVAGLLASSVRYAVATRRISVVSVVFIGMVLIALGFLVQIVAPLALYPFV